MPVILIVDDAVENVLMLKALLHDMATIVFARDRASALEQAVPQNPADQPDEVHTSDDVNEYDALEQARTVDLDDDYR